MKRIFLWEGLTLAGEKKYGVIARATPKSTITAIQQQGFFQIKVIPVNSRVLERPLGADQIIGILDALISVFSSGIPLHDGLELLISNRKPTITCYVFTTLRDQLHQGSGLEQAIRKMVPLFPRFFSAMIAVSEKSGKLESGLLALKEFYQLQLKWKGNIEKSLRYPKIILSVALLITVGIIMFIIPMFSNIYALFKGDLPVLTQWLIMLSDFFQYYGIHLLLSSGVLFSWYYLPGIHRFHPIKPIQRMVAKITQQGEDFLLYSYAMNTLLTNGESVDQASLIAAECLSPDHQRHGIAIRKRLVSGLTFSQAFSQIVWFPAVFSTYMAAAEKTGMLQVGFKQVFLFISKGQEARFEKWEKLIEPVSMLFVGGLVLMILLAVYMPIFDLGNQLG